MKSLCCCVVTLTSTKKFDLFCYQFLEVELEFPPPYRILFWFSIGSDLLRYWSCWRSVQCRQDSKPEQLFICAILIWLSVTDNNAIEGKFSSKCTCAVLPRNDFTSTIGLAFATEPDVPRWRTLKQCNAPYLKGTQQTCFQVLSGSVANSKHWISTLVRQLRKCGKFRTKLKHAKMTRWKHWHPCAREQPEAVSDAMHKHVFLFFLFLGTLFALTFAW